MYYFLYHQDTESDVKNHHSQFEQLQKAAGTYKQELTNARESTEMVDNSMRLWERRWNDLNVLLGETKKKVQTRKN